MTGRIELVGTAEILKPLPPHRWAVAGLAIGAGRPTVLAGSPKGKVLAVQSLVLALAAGRPVWGRFPCSRARVLHVHEQTFRGVAGAYQRLARGMQLDVRELAEDQLALASARPLPDSLLAELASRYDVIVLESARVVGDELTRLTRAGQDSGCSFIACAPRCFAAGEIPGSVGCVLNFSRAASESLVRVTQVKAPSAAHGKTIGAFRLSIVCGADSARIECQP